MVQVAATRLAAVTVTRLLAAVTATRLLAARVGNFLSLSRQVGARMKSQSPSLPGFLTRSMTASEAT